jgi:oligopeptide transport system substrate-binding protein
MARRRIGIPLVGAVLLLAAACSGGTNDSTSTSSGATTANAGGSTAASSAAPTTATAPPSTVSDATGAQTTADGSFTFAVGEPDHLTPGRQTVAYDEMGVLYAPLTFVNDDGSLSFRQAESVTSTDNTTWTVKLKSGWTFQNGEPVTAQSYVDAWNYTAYGPNAWANNGQFQNVVGYTDLNPTAKGATPKTKTMSGLKVIDATSFSVTLTGPDSQFAYSLSQGNTAWFPMPEAAYKDIDGYDKNPIGNGPYKMAAAWVANKPFTVTAYDGYKGPKPATKNIVFQSYADMNTGYTDVLANATDIVFVPPSKFTAAPTDFGSRLHALPAPGVDYLGMPLTDKRFSNPLVRQAFSLAIDRNAVNKAIYGGLYDPATALTPIAMVGSPQNICEYCTFDPAKAKQLLAQAGGWSGPLKIIYPGGLGADELFTAYANQLRQNLGIADVTATPTTDFNEYFTQLTAGKVDGIHFGHWGALVPTMQDTLHNLFTKGGGCYPCTTYSNPDVDKLMAAAAAAKTPAEASAGYVAVQKRVLQDFPTIPTFSDKYVYAVSTKIKDFPANNGIPDLSRVTLNQ